MTTQVIIKSPRPNHEAVRVDQINPATGEVYPIHYHILDGEHRAFYVHSGAELRITEVPKSAAPTAVPAELSFGQKAVGASFNPSGDAGVANCKDEFAVIIDRMNSLRATSADPEVKRMASLAITEAQTAQMWAVKALTWKS